MSPSQRLSLTGLVAGIWLLAGVGSAQSSIGGDVVVTEGDGIPAGVRAEVLERDREWIHPGDALRIVGREMDGNDFRSKTPALAEGQLTPAQVDLDALRERKLAMYAESGTFDFGPRAEAYEPTGREAEQQAADEPEDDSEKQPFPWTLPVGIAALAFVAFRSWQAS